MVFKNLMYNPEKPYKDRLIELISSTWETPYVSVKKEKGSPYPIAKKKFSALDALEVDHVDGIGTKGVYHWEKRTFRNAVLDAMAMNLNDLLLMRARAYRLQNHIMIPEDNNEAILEIVKSLSDECRKRDIAITGGETSIHNNIKGLEIGVTVSGFVENYKENKFQSGDLLIGIASSGLHSNGFTRVRELFKDEFRKEFVLPTLIYSDVLLDVLNKHEVHGMMHITGGAFTKLKPLLDNADASINRKHKLNPHKIFLEIYNKGVLDEEMYKTFNCGIGFVLSATPNESKKILDELNKRGFHADTIGYIKDGNNKIKLESMFGNKEIEF